MVDKSDKITTEKIEKYFDVTGRALKKLRLTTDKSKLEDAKDFYDMAQRYYSDAQHFFKKDDLVNAFAALNYAHGWLDAGARIELFEVDGDNVLFTVDAEHVEKRRGRSH
ncbi:MAG TPA: DUF357 domain-containing protein [Acidobacteriota bacterium]|nr:DUF357 domain-containing protein [Acidobacteriota bacterium]